MAQEPEGSSPHSQQPTTGPCPEPVESNPHLGNNRYLNRKSYKTHKHKMQCLIVKVAGTCSYLSA
jgi:hypothetical protein